MSDSPEPTWPGSPEVEALVGRVVAERVDPLRAQLTTVGRALALLAERVPPPLQVGHLAERIDVLARRIEEMAPASAVEAALGGEVDVRLRAQADDLRHAIATAVDDAVARLDGARRADADNLAQALARIDAARAADADRIVELVTSLEAPIQRDAEERRAQTDELRQALAVAVAHAVAKVDQARNAEVTEFRSSVAEVIEQAVARVEASSTVGTAAVARSLEQLESARTAEAARLLEQVATLAEALTREADSQGAEADQLRASIAGALDRAVAEIEAARSADAARLLEKVTALEEPLSRDAIARQAQLDDLRHTVATTLDQAVSRIEAAGFADAARFLEQVAGLVEKAESDARRRDEQARALLAAVDERLQSLHRAGDEAGDARDARLVTRLEALTAEHGSALVARIDERTAAITDLEAIPSLVGAEVQTATAAALTSQVQPLVARLVDAIDTLAHEGGRIEAMARGHAGEARAVEERVAALFVEVAQRAESAVDHSRARISEGQVALSTRFDTLMGEMLTSIGAATDRLEARLGETSEALRAAGGHQNGALLDAVNRSSQQLGNGLAEIRSALFAAGSESTGRGLESDQRAQALGEQLDALRATVEFLRQDPRIEALVVEQMAAREAQLAAIAAVSSRIDDVGPVVARALLAEVERAARAASAAEEAVAGLQPEALRSALGDAADEIRLAASRFDQGITGLADQVAQGLAALGEGQEGIRARLAAPSDMASAARIEELDRSLAAAVTTLAATMVSSRDELLALANRALEHSTVLADEVALANGTALDDLRASQTTLRELVQDGAHKAERAALDIRGLRDRLTPHLAALADATTRRADADQAGFDAVLARLDQLLVVRQRWRPADAGPAVSG